MAIPTKLLEADDDWNLFLEASILLDEQAKRLSGEDFDLDAWERVLGTSDFHWVVLSHFMGTWENSGSFVNEVGNWQDEQARVKAALRAFSCLEAARLYDVAFETYGDIHEALATENLVEIPPELLARREAINREAEKDTPYTKLSAVLRQNPERFFTEVPADELLNAQRIAGENNLDKQDNISPLLGYAFNVVGEPTVGEIGGLTLEEAAARITATDDYGQPVERVPVAQTSRIVFLDFCARSLVLDPSDPAPLVGEFVTEIVTRIVQEMCPRPREFGFRVPPVEVLRSRICRLSYDRSSNWWFLVLDPP